MCDILTKAYILCVLLNKYLALAKIRTILKKVVAKKFNFSQIFHKILFSLFPQFTQKLTRMLAFREDLRKNIHVCANF
jgi:hypothetical protein